MISVTASTQDGAAGPCLRLLVGDDGIGGADPARGSGLAGLAQRVAVVDGRLQHRQPAGRPDPDHGRAAAAGRQESLTCGC